MFQSRLFYKTLKEAPKEAKTISHKLLVRGSFIDQVSAGIWSLLPLGFRVFKKIENIIREEMNKISGQEVFLPTLQPKELWTKSGRWHKMEPPLFKLKDQHKKEYALGSTHEEVITDLARRFITSYRQLPLYLYQIQNKFRNEIRVSGGLLRVKEFIMKDLYSFHTDEKDLDTYYQKVLKAYKNIFKRCHIEVRVVKALSGSIGGDYCHEFMALTPSGEDKILLCRKCGLAQNLTAVKKEDKCPNCQGKLSLQNGIEAAHIFKLGTSYSEKLSTFFIDKNGRKRPIQMGCYGIGLGRLMATVVEIHHDLHGIIWPQSLAPFDIHLLSLTPKQNKFAKSIYKKLLPLGLDVLYDDRDVSPSVKLKDSDLIGIPLRLVVSEKTKNKIEVKKRSKSKKQLISLSDLLNKLS